MKKFFLFAAVAGMLASCSSESLTGSDPNIEPTQEERVPILLGVSSPSVNVSRGTTRGTGTVGGVGVPNTDPTNVWYGQRINAFMFTKDKDHKTTLNLTNDGEAAYYDNAVMITPGTTENKIPGQSTATYIGEAMLEDGKIQYYPHYGNFDFFGYHGAGVTGEVDKTTAATTLWTVPFTIDGSNDLMSTKAVLTDDQITAMGGSADYYSAKAARKGVQPILSFNHLLSRLAFVIKAGNDNAGGWDPTTAPAVLYADAAEYNAAKGTSLDDAAFALLDDAEKIKTPAVTAHQDADKAVYVKSIEVLSKTTGKMAVAWTAADPGELITWDDNGTPDDLTDDGAPDWLALQERPYAYETLVPTHLISKAAYDALDPGTPGKDDYTLTDVNTNFNLVALTPTYPVLTKSATDATPDDPTPIGEALIVAPNTGDYQLRVTISQKVPTNWNTPTVLNEKTQTYNLNIPVPVDDPATDTVNEAGFQANTSYKVILTVYGFERIVVKTEITPWQTGADISVGQD